MDNDVPQLGVGQQRQKLVLSPSYIQRGRPAASFTVSSSVKPALVTAPYVTHLTVPASSSSLLSYTDDGAFRIHDKTTLQLTRSFGWGQGGPCSAIRTLGQSFVTAGRNGVLGCWDSRQETPSFSLLGPSRAPYLCVATSECLIAGGTELHGADATIDVWDVRQPSAPILTYAEAHSDDVTSLDFHPGVGTVLLSASSDALVAINDTRQTNEDDSVIGVVNTGASVARAGWGGSRRTFAKQASIDDDDDDDEAQQAVAFPPLPSLGAFYSVSDMQTIGIYEADGFTELLPIRDARQTQMPVTELLPPWETEYVIDASASATLLQGSGGEGVGLFCGDQRGAMALIEVTPSYSAESSSDAPEWLLHCSTNGGHTDIVRSVVWDAATCALYSGGEDGCVCVWSMSGQQSHSLDETIGAAPPMQSNLTAGPIRQHKAGAPRDGPQRSSSSYKPY